MTNVVRRRPSVFVRSTSPACSPSTSRPPSQPPPSRRAIQPWHFLSARTRLITWTSRAAEERNGGRRRNISRRARQYYRHVPKRHPDAAVGNVATRCIGRLADQQPQLSDRLTSTTSAPSPASLNDSHATPLCGLHTRYTQPLPQLVAPAAIAATGCCNSTACPLLGVFIHRVMLTGFLSLYAFANNNSRPRA